MSIQTDLLKMQFHSVEILRATAEEQIPEARQARHLALLQKNSEEMITLAERAELAALREQADQLMLSKAYAWALLHQLGYPVHAFEEIAVN